MSQPFSPGALVTARGRDWVVLPPRERDVLRLRSLTGAGAETGLFLPLERSTVRPAQFPPPKADQPGDAVGLLTLFDAARLSLRAGAAPFRSLGRLAVVPRPYQYVPLIMALRLDPVRLLIADDVGVGKTIEAAMIARELLDRGIVHRLAVLCPAHLCDQWHKDLSEKFALEAEIIQPSRIARLERDLPRQDISIYEHYPRFIGSIDLLKSPRHREPFLRHAPDLVIVDEAHGAARPPSAATGQEQQRHELVRALAADPRRHLLLVTATPHSGIEESFRSLLGLLDPALDRDPSKPIDNRALLPYIVQRRRADVEKWLGAETPFPERKPQERTYTLSLAYRRLFESVLTYCRETVDLPGLRAAQQRVRHWAAIAMLRCVLSSPAAAAAVLSARAERQASQIEDTAEGAEVDDTYRPQVFDPLDEEAASDIAPTAPLEDARAAWTVEERKRLERFRGDAEALFGPEQDQKLQAAIDIVRGLLNDGFRPIVFCRFIPTAEYVAEALEKVFARAIPGFQARAVTGNDGDEERREIVAELAKANRPVLVATDCLSEGINLQEHFNAIVHYDLPWNPNRLEQREGRVDRFGQPRKEVRTVLLYGADNPVDQVVLDVLIRKASAIRKRLGVAVPVPADGERVVQTVVDNVLLRKVRPAAAQLELSFDTPDVSRLHEAWDKAEERERRQRAFFAQHGIKPDEVSREIEATDRVLGEPDAVRRFLANTLQRFEGSLAPDGKKGVFVLKPGTLSARIRAAARTDEETLRVAFDRTTDPDAIFLGRTHPAVEAVCDAVLNEAFAAKPSEFFARAGAIFTDAVARRTALLLMRLRYFLKETTEEFAEEIVLGAFERHGPRFDWLEPLDESGRKLAERARASANMPLVEKREHVAWALEALAKTPDWFAAVVDARKADLAASHDRLRKLLKAPKLDIRPHTPPDIVACVVLVPRGGR